MTLSDKVLNWLYSVLTNEYRDVDRTYRDVVGVLSQYTSIHPRTDIYTYDNGASALLVLLSGTLPVQFRGNIYRFPVAVWVPHKYPMEAPMVYVTPTIDMVVRPGQYVSGDGRIYHPYLAQWAGFWDKSSLLDLMDILKDICAKEPPLVSKQQSYPERTVSDAALSPALSPALPHPDELRQLPSISSTQQRAIQQPPPPPPKSYRATDNQHISPVTSPLAGPAPPPKHFAVAPPLDARPRNRIKPELQAAAPVFALHKSNIGYATAVPIPPHADITCVTPGMQFGAHANPVSPVTTVSVNQPLAKRQPSFQSSQQIQALNSPFGGHSRTTQVTETAFQDSNQRSFGPQSIQRLPLQNTQPPSSLARVTAAPHITPAPDLLSGPIDLPTATSNEAPLPVPVIPPNPEKEALLESLKHALYSETQQILAQNASAVAPLQTQHVALLQAHSRLEAEMNQLHQLNQNLIANEQILRHTMNDADKAIGDAKRRQVPLVDEVLVVPTVVGGQLYNLVSEERTVGDLLFVLGKALDMGRLSADVFVKQTRSLARERFLKKALIRKVARGMALDQV